MAKFSELELAANQYPQRGDTFAFLRTEVVRMEVAGETLTAEGTISTETEKPVLCRVESGEFKTLAVDTSASGTFQSTLIPHYRLVFGDADISDGNTATGYKALFNETVKLYKFSSENFAEVASSDSVSVGDAVSLCQGKIDASNDDIRFVRISDTSGGSAGYRYAPVGIVTEVVSAANNQYRINFDLNAANSVTAIT